MAKRQCKQVELTYSEVKLINEILGALIARDLDEYVRIYHFKENFGFEENKLDHLTSKIDAAFAAYAKIYRDHKNTLFLASFGEDPWWKALWKKWWKKIFSRGSEYRLHFSSEEMHVIRTTFDKLTDYAYETDLSFFLRSWDDVSDRLRGKLGFPQPLYNLTTSPEIEMGYNIPPVDEDILDKQELSYVSYPLEECESLAKKGDVKAQYVLGVCYKEGDHFGAQDLSKSQYWYEQAAEQGYIKAQVALGRLYAKSDGAQSIKWYEKAATQGSVVACYLLVILYHSKAEYTQKNPYAKKEWYERAAEAGLLTAQKNLGTWYYLGIDGFVKDHVKALYWFQKASTQGYGEAMYDIAGFYQEGLGGLKPDLQQAREWFQKAYDHGVWRAKYDLEDIDAGNSVENMCYESELNVIRIVLFEFCNRPELQTLLKDIGVSLEEIKTLHTKTELFRGRVANFGSFHAKFGTSDAESKLTRPYLRFSVRETQVIKFCLDKITEHLSEEELDPKIQYLRNDDAYAKKRLKHFSYPQLTPPSF